MLTSRSSLEITTLQVISNGSGEEGGPVGASAAPQYGSNPPAQHTSRVSAGEGQGQGAVAHYAQLKGGSAVQQQPAPTGGDGRATQAAEMPGPAPGLASEAQPGLGQGRGSAVPAEQLQAAQKEVGEVHDAWEVKGDSQEGAGATRGEGAALGLALGASDGNSRPASPAGQL